MDTNKIKEQIQLSGNIRNVAWFTHQFEKGRVYLRGSDEVMSQNVFDKFKSAIRIINDIYDNSWDINFKLAFHNNKLRIEIQGIYILFPIVNITNRNNKRHTIKDLLVEIRIYNHRNQDIRIENLKGGRLTLSYAEYLSDYFHSHLSTTKGAISNGMTLPYMDSFCTGSGEINIYQSNINGDGFTEERFMRYAMQILSLVSYESIEGTPYRYMDRIRTHSRSGSYFHLDNRRKELFFQKVINWYKQLETIPNIDITIDSTNSYSVALNENFQKFVEDVQYEANDKAKFFCILGESNNYYAYNSAPEFTTPPTVRNTFIFRSEVKNMAIEPAPQGNTTVTHIIHPSLIKYLKEEIEYELNKGKIRKSTIDRYTSESSNATESVQSNPVLVSADS